MSRKIFLLIGGIVSLLVFIGFLTESEPTEFFGFSINVWFVRAFWLLNTFIIFNAYVALNKKEKE